MFKKRDAENFLLLMEELMRDSGFHKISKYSKTRHWLEQVNLVETNYSAILRWLLDPNEGHGLGDFFLKRLLIAVNCQLDEEKYNVILKKRIKTGDWIDTCDISIWSFQTTFVVTEINSIDILAVDPVNEIVVCIERKDGSKIRKYPNKSQFSSQLEKYEQFVNDSFPHFYKLFVLSDSQEKEHELSAKEKNWIQINDDWLIETLEEACIQGRTDHSTSIRLRLLKDIFEGEYVDMETYYQDLEDEINYFCARNRNNINLLKNNPFAKLSSRDLISCYSKELLGGEKCDGLFKKASIIAAKYHDLNDVFCKRGLFAHLINDIEQYAVSENIEFDEKINYLAVSTEFVDELSENNGFPEWPIYLTIYIPSYNDEVDSEQTGKPFIRIDVDFGFLEEEQKDKFEALLREKSGYKVRNNKASAIHRFTDVDQLFQSSIRINSWVDNMIHISRKLNLILTN